MIQRILCVVGTRPEAIKMAPVILALREDPRVELRVLATAQHRELLDQVLELFNIKPDLDLDVMRPNQSLPELSARLMTALDTVLADQAPDAVLAQGDTTTVLMTALACFYRRIPFGHVEAGLRTGRIDEPFPEEMNRVLTTPLARWHFAPTESARMNLLEAGVEPDRIFVTGNTVIDALLMTAKKDIDLGLAIDPSQRLILVTAHRRENFGLAMREICEAILELAERNLDIHFLYPVHPNPNVTKVVNELLSGHARISLVPPMDYGPFIMAMKRAYLILTDSGGVQEEAPALAKPVLVLRDVTERPEAVEEGVVRLVGPHREAIVRECEQLLRDTDAYRQMARGISPYGDGAAAQRIRAALLD